MENYVIALDIGGTNIRIGVLDESFQLTRYKKVYQESIFSGANPIENLVNFLAEYIQSECAGLTISALAVGVPSALNRSRRLVLSTPNIPNLNNIYLADELEEKLQLPVFTERDVCMLYFHDKLRYGLPDQGVVIACYIGTGIGNVIAIDGKILYGRDGVAGELGHIPTLGRIDLCGCGNKGCSELYAGGKMLEQIAALKGVFIKDIFSKAGDTPDVLQYIDAIAATVATEINILNPEIVVLGGGVLAMKDFPQSMLEQYIHNHTRKPYPDQTLRFIYSEDADKNGIMGGGIYVHNQLKGA